METETREPTDIFLWANNTDGIKKELDVEIFLFNKNYTPYTTPTVWTETFKEIRPTRHMGELSSDRPIPDHLKKPGWQYKKGKR